MSPCILSAKPYIANSLSSIDDYSEFSFEGEISQLQIEKSVIKAQRGGHLYRRVPFRRILNCSSVTSRLDRKKNGTANYIPYRGNGP